MWNPFSCIFFFYPLKSTNNKKITSVGDTLFSITNNLNPWGNCVAKYTEKKATWITLTCTLIDPLTIIDEGACKGDDARVICIQTFTVGIRVATKHSQWFMSLPHYPFQVDICNATSRRRRRWTLLNCQTTFDNDVYSTKLQTLENQHYIYTP